MGLLARISGNAPDLIPPASLALPVLAVFAAWAAWFSQVDLTGWEHRYHGGSCWKRQIALTRVCGELADRVHAFLTTIVPWVLAIGVALTPVDETTIAGVSLLIIGVPMAGLWVATCLDPTRPRVSLESRIATIGLPTREALNGYARLMTVAVTIVAAVVAFTTHL
jgi:hypothetical protein